MIRRIKAHLPSMVDILLMSTPFEVLHTIVVAYAVLVVDVWLVAPALYEEFGYYLMSDVTFAVVG